jgi:hypothetical protein
MGKFKVMTAVAILLMIFGSSATAAFGQAITGTLLGTVSDSSGAVIAGADVSVKNMNTGVAYSTITGAEGYYTVPNLAPGKYSVTVQYKGFKTGISEGDVVQVEQTTRVDFTLSAGEVSEHVQVSAEVPLVQSTTSDIGSVIEAQQINSLPLNGRLFEQLVTITAGAAAAGWSDFAENPSAAGAVTPTQAVVNGLPWSGNLYLVDGIHNEEPLNAFISITTPLADIQEFKIETSNPTAEYGSFGGAVVNLTTKSGTNQYHGEAFEYIRNDAFNARDFFATTKAPYHAHQFGGAVGGPIRKDKLFFFADYQQLRQHNGVTNTLTVPTALQRQGILTEGAQTAISNPAVCQPVACTGNTIPAADINPISAAVLNSSVIPLPNVPGSCGGLCNNFVANTLNTQNVPQFDVRVDYAHSDHDRFFVRESYAHRNFTDPSPGTIFMFGGPNSTSSNHNAVISWDHIFSGTMTNSFRAGFNRYDTSDSANANGIDENNLLGIPNGNLADQPNTSGIAQFNIPGFAQSGAPGLTGDPGWTNAVRIANIFEYSDNFVMIRGKHSLKFGGDIQRIQSTLTNSQDDPRGIFNFKGAYSGNQFADFLLGYPNEVIRDIVATRPGVRITFAGFFAQDDYRITPKLTLNLGLRWDLYTPPVDSLNRQSNFVPSTGLIQIASSGNRGPNVDTYHGNWGPRVGLAYSPDNGKTAIRAAYGISYFPDNFGANGGTLERNYPFFLIVDQKAPSQTVPSLNLSNGLPAPTPVATTPGESLNPPPNFGVFVVAKNFRQDEAQVWNFSVERQLTSTMSLQAAYVGTHGTHLYRDLQLNQCDPAVAAVTPPPTCLPYFAVAPTVTTVDQRNGDGYSHYNAAQIQLQKRTDVGLTLTVAYTWSKMIDDVSNVVYPYQDSLNRALSAGFKGSDIPQNLAISYNYDLPFGTGRRWLNSSSGLVGHLVTGWSASGITIYQSGTPLQITVGSNLLGNNGGSNPADVTCGQVHMPRTVNKWFDTSCFTAPPAFRFGNSGVGHVFGPGISNWDFSLAKSTALGSERRQLRFEANFFNLFNAAHFANPNTTEGTTSFGVISSDRLPPRYVQFGLKLSF